MVSVSGGEKLTAKLNDMSRALGKRGSVEIGFLSGAVYPDGTPVAMIAAIHNYGAPRAGIPPRPFFSNMVKDKSPEWPDAIQKLLKRNNYKADEMLRLVGMAIKEQLQQAIRDFSGVPLKPATIKRKGFSKQLIDTKHMLNSVAFKVKS